LPGATVQWAATIGAATLTPTQSVTNDDGLAQTSVVLESTSDVFVSAVVPGLLPVIFRLHGLDPCDFNSWSEIMLGSTVAGTLQPNDCEIHGGQFHQFHRFHLSSQQALIIGVKSTAFDPIVELYSGEPWYLWHSDTVNATRDAWTKVILPQGSYTLGATTIDPGVTGPYTVRLVPTSESQESCEFVMVMAGITTTQTLASSDCADPAGRSEDRFFLPLVEGQTVTLTQSSRHVTAHIRLIRQDGQVVAEADGAGIGPAMLTFTSDVFSGYSVHVSSSGAEQLGEYTLFITRGDGASTSLSSSRDVGPLGRPGIRDRAILGVRPGGVGRGAAALHR
jgi:hypothetical protein